MSSKGLFVVFEGVDGSGKSTQVELVSRLVMAAGFSVLTTREPGGSDVSERIRELILSEADLDVWTEVMLMAASRIEHGRRTILPAIEDGKVVLSDRYVGSSLVYQGLSRGVSVDAILGLNHLSEYFVEPDLVFLLDLERPRRDFDGTTFEARGYEYWMALRSGYKELAATLRWHTVDASAPAAEIAEEVGFQILETLATIGKERDA